MRPIRVLSLFDGMSCGQIALRDLGIPIEVYYASEIGVLQDTAIRLLGNVWTAEVIKHILSFMRLEDTV